MLVREDGKRLALVFDGPDFDETFLIVRGRFRDEHRNGFPRPSLDGDRELVR